ncbi:galactose-binding like protein [Gloeophyllum trabeum ATCC 11539]|uniref:Galactose-binding like protein n=1 Tax=Gloeophyllum trabeum (strain ATCC 11539 / FP-39264 / Madison 617) TaxID=670483 RepID=S7S329_GLOTA|nr:galactose-binding like protein [Gloeophyllum trabeum ATCC 11539]EPQ60229.1 galactose-binding like protein [Gloeophyllum trabeum ATCC 11539]
MRSLITDETKIKVSSTLDKSVGKKYLTDGNPDTCWTSQQGLPQYVQLTFPGPVLPRKISLTFQGGFVGTKCAVEAITAQQAGSESSKGWQMLSRIYPEDVNRQQIFDLTPVDPTLHGKHVEALRVVFEESSDFFGRVTVYDLQLEGETL